MRKQSGRQTSSSVRAALSVLVLPSCGFPISLIPISLQFDAMKARQEDIVTFTISVWEASERIKYPCWAALIYYKQEFSTVDCTLQIHVWKFSYATSFHQNDLWWDQPLAQYRLGTHMFGLHLRTKDESGSLNSEASKAPLKWRRKDLHESESLVVNRFSAWNSMKYTSKSQLSLSKQRSSKERAILNVEVVHHKK